MSKTTPAEYVDCDFPYQRQTSSLRPGEVGLMLLNDPALLRAFEQETGKAAPRIPYGFRERLIDLFTARMERRITDFAYWIVNRGDESM